MDPLVIVLASAAVLNAANVKTGKELGAQPAHVAASAVFAVACTVAMWGRVIFR